LLELVDDAGVNAGNPRTAEINANSIRLTVVERCLESRSGIHPAILGAERGRGKLGFAGSVFV